MPSVRMPKRRPPSLSRALAPLLSTHGRLHGFAGQLLGCVLTSRVFVHVHVTQRPERGVRVLVVRWVQRDGTARARLRTTPGFLDVVHGGVAPRDILGNAPPVSPSSLPDASAFTQRNLLTHRHTHTCTTVVSTPCKSCLAVWSALIIEGSQWTVTTELKQASPQSTLCRTAHTVT